MRKIKIDLPIGKENVKKMNVRFNGQVMWEGYRHHHQIYNGEFKEEIEFEPTFMDQMYIELEIKAEDQ